MLTEIELFKSIKILGVTLDWHLSNKKHKALDAVNHRLLLAKRKAYGFSPYTLEMISSYLLGCQQCVSVAGLCSNFKSIKTGVPQGSFLGPLLSNIFINDLNCVPSVSLRLYADSTTAYLSDVSPTILKF